MKPRCQICGRRKHLRKNGTIVFHHVRGDRCDGAGFLPIEQDDARLVAIVAEREARYDRLRAEIADLEERRANYIDPALIRARNYAWLAYREVEKRLVRHRDWPARYARSIARQMEKHGYAWADPPPAYLLARSAPAAASAF